MVTNAPHFDYKFSSVRDLSVLTAEDPKNGKRVVNTVVVQGEPVKPTRRFWTSFYARYGFGGQFFKYFTHDEVFRRIAEVESQDQLRLCIERGGDGENHLLAVSNPAKPLVMYDSLIETLRRYGAAERGIVRSCGLAERKKGGVSCW